MQNFLLILCLYVVFVNANAQQKLPGGVSDVCVWNVTEKSSGNTSSWKTQLANTADSSWKATGKSYILNNNPALFFTGNQNPGDISYNLGKLPAFSLFTVCQEPDTLAERVIFCVENDTSVSTVLSDKRLADINTYKYSNFGIVYNHLPRIYSYLQNKSADTSITSRRLRFGQTPRAQKIPVSALRGIVPEIILFNRNLSYKEKTRVETYLALKYGISLNQVIPTHYLNSKSEIIWNADINRSFGNNIAGIGRDDISGLNQPESESLQTPGLFKVETLQTLANNNFLIWGDNGGELKFVEQYNIPKCLGRTWKLNTTQFAGKSISLKTKVLAINEINPQAAGESYWLMVDRSGYGTFNIGNTNYIKSQPMSSARGTIYFDAVNVDADNSGSDAVTLISMPDLILRSQVINPQCSAANQGKIITEIVGGQAPYQVKITDIANNTNSKTQKVTGNHTEFANISQGAYMVQVTDKNNINYTEKVWVSNAHNWESSIKSTYNLKEGESITLDASLNMPGNSYQYSWLTPSGENINTGKLTISYPGVYHLSIINIEGCKSTMEFSVKQTSSSNIDKLELFPNPATGGNFITRVNLKSASSLKVTITTASGNLISTETLNTSNYFWYNGFIKQSGIYFITVQSGNNQETLKLIVP